MNMKDQLILFIVANCLLLAVSVLQASAFKVVNHDLDVAETGKEQSFEKGGEAGHHSAGEEAKGEKGEKGYESKHG